jgi:dihydroorotate dehydrogenase (NAD+) catalytic subunit
VSNNLSSSGIKLSVKIGSFILPNPVIVASGTFGYGVEFKDLLDLSKLGAIVTKGLSLRPRRGNPGPRICETPSGMLNSIGLANIGINRFLKEKLPALKDQGARVIVNILGKTIEEYKKLAEKLEHTNIEAIEANLSCPNVNQGGMHFGRHPQIAAQVTEAIRSVTSLPLIIKLSPNVDDIQEIAKAVQEAGADAISAINTIKAMSIDIQTRKPSLGSITGGLSGPAIRPIAIRIVWEIAKVVDIPIIGIGGIMKWQDAIEFLLAGASAIQVGTANLIHPKASIKILEGIELYCQTNNIEPSKLKYNLNKK